MMSHIEREPNWELVVVFADEGKTGTNTKKRKAFNRMIDSAKRGEFDLIVTKEMSRFARNTLDSITYTRELKKRGIGVIFLNDSINTLDPDAELRLTIMSSIAQELCCKDTQTQGRQSVPMPSLLCIHAADIFCCRTSYPMK